MKRLILIVALASAGCAYQNPTQPTYEPPSTTAPSTLTIGSSLTQAGVQSVSVHVQNINGAPLAGVQVAFYADGGSLSDAAVKTNISGVARTTWTGNAPAGVEAVVGPLTAHWLVIP